MWFSGRSRRSVAGREVAPEEIFLDSMNIESFDRDRLEGKIEYALGRRPFAAVGVLIAFGFLLLAARALYLQALKGDEFALRAERNRTFTLSLPAPRGIIYDRYRAPLAKNISSFEVVVKRNGLPDEMKERQRIFDALALILKKTPHELQGAGFDPLLEARNLPPEIVLMSEVPRDVVVELEARSGELPGVAVRGRELRAYAGPAFSHLTGYVGKISAEELAENPEYAFSDLIGKDGLEARYEALLKGGDGEQVVEMDATRGAFGDLPTRLPIIGKSLILNIDAGLQQTLFESLARHIAERGKFAGSAVALDPRNGAVRALVSLPSYDPNIFRKRISEKDYQEIFLAKTNPLFNRAIAGEYPSGSVIKPMVAAAALEEKIIDPNYKIFDSGSISVPNPYRLGEETVFPDWRAHGWVDLRGAIQWSANVYFYIVGGGYKDIKGLGIKKLGDWMQKFGFGSRLGIDLPGEAPGLVPGPDNIAKTRPQDPVWRLGDTYHASIGQGSFQATPLQIAAMTAAIANGGTLWQPQVVRAALDENGNVVETIEPKIIRAALGDPKSFEIVREGMRLVATDGTARAFFGDFPVEAAGKTGTAQTGYYKTAHGWFTAFAPYRAPELVIVVMAEGIGENASIATPVTRDALYRYFTEGKRRGQANDSP